MNAQANYPAIQRAADLMKRRRLADLRDRLREKASSGEVSRDDFNASSIRERADTIITEARSIASTHICVNRPSRLNLGGNTECAGTALERGLGILRRHRSCAFVPPTLKDATPTAQVSEGSGDDEVAVDHRDSSPYSMPPSPTRLPAPADAAPPALSPPRCPSPFIIISSTSGSPREKSWGSASAVVDPGTTSTPLMPLKTSSPVPSPGRGLRDSSLGSARALDQLRQSLRSRPRGSVTWSATTAGSELWESRISGIVENEQQVELRFVSSSGCGPGTIESCDRSIDSQASLASEDVGKHPSRAQGCDTNARAGAGAVASEYAGGSEPRADPVALGWLKASPNLCDAGLADEPWPSGPRCGPADCIPHGGSSESSPTAVTSNASSEATSRGRHGRRAAADRAALGWSASSLTSSVILEPPAHLFRGLAQV